MKRWRVNLILDSEDIYSKYLQFMKERGIGYSECIRSSLAKSAVINKEFTKDLGKEEKEKLKESIRNL